MFVCNFDSGVNFFWRKFFLDFFLQKLFANREKISKNLKNRTRKNLVPHGILSHGHLGKEEGIRGSLGTGWSLAQVTHLLTIFLIAVDNSGHQTDVQALTQHLLTPR